MLPSTSNRGVTGVLVGLLGAALFAVMALLVKKSHPHFNTGHLLLARAAFSVMALTFALKVNEVKALFNRGARHVWLRALFGGASVYCYYWNLRHSPLSVSTLLTDLSPVFVIVISALVVRKPLGRIASTGLLLTVIGVGLLSSPASTTHSAELLTVCVGLAGAIFGALAYLSLKQASGQFSTRTVVLAFSFVMLFVSIGEIHSMPEVDRYVDFLPLLGVAVTSLCAQLCMTYSFKVLSVETASSLVLTAALWSLGFDVYFLGLIPEATAYLAGGLILFGIKLTQIAGPTIPSFQLKPLPPSDDK